MRNRIAFALYVGPAGKCCRLSARIPNHVSENRIHAPLNAGNFTSESGMVLTELVEKIYLSYIELISRSCASPRKRDVGKSGTTTSAIVSGIFACMSSDGCKQDVEGNCRQRFK